MEGQYKRPPLGIMPRYLYEETRNYLDRRELYAYDLSRFIMMKAAIERYIAADKEVPGEWLKELKEVVDNRLYCSKNLN